MFLLYVFLMTVSLEVLMGNLFHITITLKFQRHKVMVYLKCQHLKYTDILL